MLWSIAAASLAPIVTAPASASLNHPMRRMPPPPGSKRNGS
jgi:hypothetical protein